MSFAGALDVQVRQFIYDHTIEHGVPPSARQAAAELGVAEEQLRAAFERLAAGRVLVLERDTREIQMAMPFSAFPTAFPTRVGATTYHANCAWDALGIPAALGRPATVHSRCEQTLQPLELPVTEGGPEPSDWLFHCVVPASKWWDDIVFT